MSPPPVGARLKHMLDAIAQIEAQIAGLSFEEFGEDRFRQLGIERCLEIISDASRHIPESTKTHYTEIPWRRVGDIGNRLRHAYHAVDSAIIWEIATVELRDLRRVIAHIANESNEES